MIAKGLPHSDSSNLCISGSIADKSRIAIGIKMNRLFYKQPANLWEEALPIGNGRLGAMVFGGITKEHLQLNEDSVWYGGPMDRINPDAQSNLETARKLILEGNIPEAEELLEYAFSGTPQSERPYQPLGDFEIQMKGLKSETTSYERELSLEEGSTKTKFVVDGITYHREYLISAVDNVIAIRLWSDEKEKISFDTLMTRERFFDHSRQDGSDSIILDGNLGKGGSEFCIATKVKIVDGSVSTIGEHIVVKGATEAVIYIAAETSFYHKNYIEVAWSRLEEAEYLGYEAIRKRHIANYQELYQRVELKLPYDESYDELPTDIRLQQLREGRSDNGLIATYFDFGRYLLISSSRPGSLPANLQGIWNSKMQPAWDSKYTININTEMNYWPAEICNLSECHLPLFDLLRRMQQNGKRTARKMYGCRGFVAHHNTDIWADTAPQDIYIPATYWVMGGAWLCTHIWTHYEYNMDQNWLNEMYPILQDSVLFFLDYLIEDKGELVTCPSVSPENTYILPTGVKGCVCAGASMDTQILRDLFESFLKASELLSIKGEVVRKATDSLLKLPKTKVGKHGQIMEWREDYEEEEIGHRHISQLYALHPSTQITIDKEPELAQAAKATLERRLSHGGGHTGWSCAWIVNLYARLWEGENAYENLIKLMKQSTFNNLMDNHPLSDGKVFQIDGNFGATAAIAEMLVQSDGERIVLLPALPKEWADGKVRGLCIKGGAELSMEWKNGQVEKAVLKAKHDLTVKVYCGNDRDDYSNCKEVFLKASDEKVIYNL